MWVGDGVGSGVIVGVGVGSGAVADSVALTCASIVAAMFADEPACSLAQPPTRSIASVSKRNARIFEKSAIEPLHLDTMRTKIDYLSILVNLNFGQRRHKI